MFTSDTDRAVFSSFSASLSSGDREFSCFCSYLTSAPDFLCFCSPPSSGCIAFGPLCTLCKGCLCLSPCPLCQIFCGFAKHHLICVPPKRTKSCFHTEVRVFNVCLLTRVRLSPQIVLPVSAHHLLFSRLCYSLFIFLIFFNF